MKYQVYQITNNINSKKYIGVHRGDIHRDGYFGSSSILKKSIKKYGKDNFTKEVLYTFSDAERAFECERELVNETVISNNEYYNIKLGGRGGLGGIKHSDGTKNKISKANSGKNNGMYNYEYSKKEKEYLSEKTKEWRKNNPEWVTGWLGKKHKEESKRKISDTNKILFSHLAKKVEHIETGKVFNSLQEAADFYEVTKGAIWRHCSGITKTKKFKYYE